MTRPLSARARQDKVLKPEVARVFTERLAEAGIEPSVGSVGGSYDNALTETINAL